MRITITDAIKEIKLNKLSGKDIIFECKKMAEKQKNLNIFISENYNTCIEQANHNSIPISLKDVFYLKNTKTTAASKMMKDFNSPFDGTVVDRLEKRCNAKFIGKTALCRIKLSQGLRQNDIRHRRYFRGNTKKTEGQGCAHCTSFPHLPQSICSHRADNW